MAEWSAFMFTDTEIRYMKNKKFISKKNVPGNYVPLIKVGEIFDDEGIKPLAPLKYCVFCGEVAKMTRMLNGQTIPLCDKDYYDKTIGQVAQQIREKELV